MKSKFVQLTIILAMTMLTGCGETFQTVDFGSDPELKASAFSSDSRRDGDASGQINVGGNDEGSTSQIRSQIIAQPYTRDATGEVTVVRTPVSSQVTVQPVRDDVSREVPVVRTPVASTTNVPPVSSQVTVQPAKEVASREVQDVRTPAASTTNVPTVSLPVISQPRAETVRCAATGRTLGLDTLKNSILTNSGDQVLRSPDKFGTNCEASLVKFVARSVDANGLTVKILSNSTGSARLEVYCAAEPDLTSLRMTFFYATGLRAANVSKTYFCKLGTAGESCSPSSPNFIGGLKYKDDGSPRSDVIPDVLTPGGGLYTENGCGRLQIYSPVVIERVARGGVRTINPFRTQTFFDLTGDGRNERISCLRDGAFLALPDANGKIRNIDQLFGDNTVGPDGLKSSDGYAALGKYDQKTEAEGRGVLTARDKIFQYLRLWDDRNCNGLAESAEIELLSDWNITAIYWANPIPMNEVDRFGNATLLRHFVERLDQERLRSFDIWFKDHSVR